MIYDVIIDGRSYRVELLPLSPNGPQPQQRWLCRVDGRELEVDAALTERDVLSLIVEGQSYQVTRELTPTDTHVVVGGRRYAAEVRDPRSLRARRAAADTAEGPKKLAAPMPGKVVRILLAENAAVEAGQGVLVVEAMKMQNEIKSPKSGVVRQILVAEGSAVNAGDPLAVVE